MMLLNALMSVTSQGQCATCHIVVLTGNKKQYMLFAATQCERKRSGVPKGSGTNLSQMYNTSYMMYMNEYLCSVW